MDNRGRRVWLDWQNSSRQQRHDANILFLMWMIPFLSALIMQWKLGLVWPQQIFGPFYTVMYEVHVGVSNIIHGMIRANLEGNVDPFRIVNIRCTSCVAF